ncbi:hypothetical protein RFI_16827 [Reticulomyxa filosa]|uniref:Uncharacterized protein n=1 Tax=Reticulomyxa filosa TaxID=46433 RepID=X6N2C0_RETFI|nr:hypothetical protein RFI_16827 [Reticulomyxa filosa]|eukprot:ETO20390.1 hypothetical protein RFI_16827 [Reticulomyxa filosa]
MQRSQKYVESFVFFFFKIYNSNKTNQITQTNKQTNKQINKQTKQKVFANHDEHKLEDATGDLNLARAQSNLSDNTTDQIKQNLQFHGLSEDYLHLIARNTNLAIVAMTSNLVTGVTMLIVGRWLMLIDIFMNLLCIYLCFSVAQPVYRCLCKLFHHCCARYCVGLFLQCCAWKCCDCDTCIFPCWVTGGDRPAWETAQSNTTPGTENDKNFDKKDGECEESHNIEI